MTQSGGSLSADAARLVWPLSVAQLVSWGTLYYGFTLFLEPMEADLGLARTELTGALTVGLLISGVCSIPVGALVDRGHARLLMSGASLAGGVLLIAWSQVQTSAQFFVVWACLGVVLAGALYEPAFAVLVRTLGERGRRGIASLTLIGGLASTAFIPLTYALIEQFDWRMALVALALFNILIAAPINFFTLAGQSKLRSTERGRERTGPALVAAMRRPVFWWLTIAFTAAICSISAVVFHIVPMLSERGYALALVVSAVSLIGPAQVAGRFIVTLIAKNLGLGLTGCVAFGFPVAAFAIILLAPEGFWTIACFTIALGIGNGVMTILRATSIAEIFGAQGYGAINGAIAFPVTVARALAPSLAALIWVATGGYDTPLWTLLSISALALAAFFCALISSRAEALRGE